MATAKAKTKKDVNLNDLLSACEKPKTKKPASKKNEVIIDDINDNVKNAIDEYVKAKKEYNKAKSEMNVHAAIIKEAGQKEYEKRGRSNNFSKSFKIKGNNDQINFVTADYFGIDQADIGICQEIIEEDGKDPDDFIEKNTTMTLKKEVLEDEVLSQELAKILGSKLSKFFDVEVEHKAVKGFDQKIFSLSNDAQDDLRTYAKQKQPSLR